MSDDERLGVDHDRAVKSTCSDAASCKWSASKLGYIQDPYIQYFVSTQQQIKMPIINRGYYSRSRAIDQVLDGFLCNNSRTQVIVLGAGHDTTYFRIRSCTDRVVPTNFIEIDFPDINRKKVQIYRRREVFWRMLGFESAKDFSACLSKGSKAYRRRRDFLMIATTRSIKL